MNYNDYIAEYVAAGLIVTASSIIVVLDILGWLPKDVGVDSPIHLLLSISSLPGAVGLLLSVLISYPIGYLLFSMGLFSMRLFGRQSIYAQETQILTRHPYSDWLLAIERESGTGYAQGSDFERPFSLVRLYLIGREQEAFAFLNAYWTRLSRTFGALSSSFLFSGFIFLALWSIRWTQSLPSQASAIAPWLAAIFLLLYILLVSRTGARFEVNCVTLSRCT